MRLFGHLSMLTEKYFPSAIPHLGSQFIVYSISSDHQLQDCGISLSNSSALKINNFHSSSAKWWQASDNSKQVIRRPGSRLCYCSKPLLIFVWSYIAPQLLQVSCWSEWMGNHSTNVTFIPELRSFQPQSQCASMHWQFLQIYIERPRSNPLKQSRVLTLYLTSSHNTTPWERAAFMKMFTSLSTAPAEPLGFWGKERSKLKISNLE